jgi:hypothetical protein
MVPDMMVNLVAVGDIAWPLLVNDRDYAHQHLMHPIPIHQHMCDRPIDWID